MHHSQFYFQNTTYCEMNRCHQKTCVQKGILECENCKRNGFPPLRYCSQTCALEILPEHNRIWHPIETTYVLQAIPLVEVRDQEAKQATFLFTPLGRALVQKMCLENKKGVRIVSIQGLSRAGKSSRMCWLLRMLGVQDGRFEVEAGLTYDFRDMDVRFSYYSFRWIPFVTF